MPGSGYFGSRVRRKTCGINGEFIIGDALECEFELEGEKYILPATVVRKIDKIGERDFIGWV